MSPEIKKAGFVGVDGCRGGWTTSAAEEPVVVFRTFDEILKKHKRKVILVDLPVGLPETTRDLDRSARKKFDVQPSSIFSVPCRAAIYADSYQEACEVNERKTGKKISKQIWNIAPKIREVDRCLRVRPELCRYVFESHPEICFSVIKGDRLTYSKKKPEGAEERAAQIANAKVPTRVARDHLRRSWLCVIRAGENYRRAPHTQASAGVCTQ